MCVLLIRSVIFGILKIRPHRRGEREREMHRARKTATRNREASQSVR